MEGGTTRVSLSARFSCQRHLRPGVIPDQVEGGSDPPGAVTQSKFAPRKCLAVQIGPADLFCLDSGGGHMAGDHGNPEEERLLLLDLLEGGVRPREA